MTACAFPTGSRLSPRLGEAYYHDSFDAPLRRPDLKMHEIYMAVLGRFPRWVRALLAVRNALVAPFGLRTEGPARVWRPGPEGKLGERIGLFELFSQDETEIISGLDDKHLDFRVSVMKVRDQGIDKVVVSTLIFAHNVFGKAYLRFILPFHKLVIASSLSDATAQGRI